VGLRRVEPRARIRKEYSWYGSDWALSGETRYLYDGRRVIQERNSGNTPTVSYTRGPDLSGSFEGAGGIGGLLGRSHGYSGGNWSTHNHYHADGNGNITYLVNSSQGLAASYRYDPYGRLMGSSGTLAAANLYRFSSKELHAKSGMYGYGFRFYDPHLQRWLNRDPIFEAGGINLYGFVSNDPTNLIDPFGESWFCRDVSQERWDKLNRRHGAPLRKPGLDDWEEMILKSGRKGAFVTRGEAAEGAGVALDVGITAAAGMALPNTGPLRAVQVGRAARTLPGRSAALRSARDAGGVPRSAQPSRVYHERLRNQLGNVQGRVYEYARQDGCVVTIREHSLGHSTGNLGPHFNVEIRPPGGGPRLPLPGGGDGHFYFQP
jgi:RHS repeat-associated protein